MYSFRSATYTSLSPKLFEFVSPPNLSNPSLLLFNSSLAKSLGIDPHSCTVDSLLGSHSCEKSFAQAYAGHQFGHFTMLGDGRAIILGEHSLPSGECVDIQLKGSGRTKFSRGGDGLATASSMLREYVYSVVMRALGIPTSQSLAVILTNQTVLREQPYSGGILVRVMNSHIRFGTFEFVSNYCSLDEFRAFTDYVIDRHYSFLSSSSEKYLLFFQEVMKKCISTVVEWLRVGFVHGVMNTDNMSIVGLTFDYGPCSFMNRYHSHKTFSQIDQLKRYSFSRQRDMLKWNLSVLGETLLPLFGSDDRIAQQLLVQELSSFDELFSTAFFTMMKNKLGSKDISPVLIEEFLLFLETYQLDYTSTFIELMDPGTFDDPIFSSQEFVKWRNCFSSFHQDSSLMRKYNPYKILRNHLLEEALFEFEESGSLKKINELLAVLSSPYQKDDFLNKYYFHPPEDFDELYQTHCNT